MSARTKARKRALDLLYAADMRQVPVEQLLAAEAERAVNEPERQALHSWGLPAASGAPADRMDPTPHGLNR